MPRPAASCRSSCASSFRGASGLDEDDVAALQMRADVLVAVALEQLAQLAHRDPPPLGQVDAAEEGDVPRQSLRIVSPLETVPGSITFAFSPRSRRWRYGFVLTKRCASLPEARHELDAAGVRLRRHLDHGRAECESRAGRQVLLRDVEIDVELIAGESPALAVARGDEVDDARAHQRQLRLAVGRSVRGLRAAVRAPPVPDEALVEIEHALREHLALALGRAPHDQLDDALVSRRAPDLVEPGLELLGAQVLCDRRGHRSAFYHAARPDRAPLRSARDRSLALRPGARPPLPRDRR